MSKTDKNVTWYLLLKQADVQEDIDVYEGIKIMKSLQTNCITSFISTVKCRLCQNYEMAYLMC